MAAVDAQREGDGGQVAGRIQKIAGVDGVFPGLADDGIPDRGRARDIGGGGAAGVGGRSRDMIEVDVDQGGAGQAGGAGDREKQAEGNAHFMKFG